MGCPISSVDVAADENWARSPASAAMRSAMRSAIGDLQMFPQHTNTIRGPLVRSLMLAILGSATDKTERCSVVRAKLGARMHFRTPRCTVRPMVLADIEQVSEYRNDLPWMRFQGLKGLDRQGYVERLLGRGFDPKLGGQLTIIGDALLIGDAPAPIIGDLYLRKAPPICWIGYTVAKQYSRQGYASEVVAGLIDALTRCDDVQALKADVDAENEASIGLLNKLGFSLETTSDDGLIYTLYIERN